MEQRNKGANRRGFLKLGGAAAPAAVAAVAVAAAPGARQAQAAEAPKSTGLRKTEHVKKYLETARF